MGEQYVDIYGFKPLEPALHDALMKISKSGSLWASGYTPGDAGMLKELERMGYLSNVISDFSFALRGDITEKGRRYPADYEAWDGRRNAWEAEQEEKRIEEIKDAKAHDWRLNLVNGVYAVVAAVVGALIGYLIGLSG